MPENLLRITNKSMNTPPTEFLRKRQHSSQEWEDYLYGCFLNYRDSLYVCRTLEGLIRLKKALRIQSPVDQRLTDYASSCIRLILPEIKIPGWSEKEFSDLLNNEKENKTLSDDELMEKINRDSELLREKIDSGEIDIWDDTPKYVDFDEAKSFLETSISTIENKILKACNEKVSLLEGLTKTITSLLHKRDNYGELREYEALLIIWDSSRMFYEGEPPFKIVFSSQVSEQLGIDPVMESIRSNRIRPLKPSSYESKRAKAALSICTNSRSLPPELVEISKELFSKIEFTDSNEYLEEE
jgi:hypothetical protein